MADENAVEPNPYASPQATFDAPSLRATVRNPRPPIPWVAIASLILGILSLFLPIVGAPFALGGIVCGIVRVTKDRDAESPGHELALAGALCSAASLLVPLLVFLILLGIILISIG